MLGQFRKFQKLTAPQRKWLVHAWFLLPLVWGSLWLFGFKRTRSFLADRKGARTALQPQQAVAQGLETARVVGIAAARHLHHPKCLPQSLVVWYLLARQGITTELKIGARKNAGKLEAHAWVECRGIPLQGSGSGFSVFSVV